MKALRPIVSVALSLAVCSLALAQGAGEAPKPGPEHKKLAYFVGKWKSEAEMKPSPFGPGGKMTSNDDCQWFMGNFAVVCRSEGKGPMGPSKGLGILGYSAEEKVYTYYGIDNSGMVPMSVPRGTIQGNVWTYTGEDKMGGKTIKSRYVITTSSPSSYTFKWESQGEDGSWTTVMDGTTTKAK